jgi:hypothetical protein
MSETDLDNDISVEVFLLGADRTDMASFESAGQEPEPAD